MQKLKFKESISVETDLKKKLSQDVVKKIAYQQDVKFKQTISRILQANNLQRHNNSTVLKE